MNEIARPQTDFGTAELYVPEGMFDLLAPDSDAEARSSFVDVFAQMLPRATAADLETLTDGLMTWRRRLLNDGMLMHAVVAVPAGHLAETPVHWHILVGPVRVPEAGELNAGEVVARYLGQSFDPASTYTESFATRLGWGAGLITRTPFPFQVEGPSAAQLPPVVGLSAAVTAPQHGTQGLLVVGVAFDVERTEDMARLVAVIAGQSVVHPPSDDEI
ncbi:hypothetical protein D9V41_08140 [Aeromicrobium phragmitis]|uniref:Uncharacterized protein n=1 Tax=Aeromicrobium phragmitis TaxID=2478914 RepID=A0A3L8PM39_9ACTN|nr:hypothetical protein [Aeromicrobium phragmitis]RLV55869.1 hypothetical protein D9V41_08140 [Aeromicrobium phragmitis]